jgi:hypothetical protein
VVIKVLFVALILSTAALVAVGIAMYFRVRRHLQVAKSEGETPSATEASVQNQETGPVKGAFEG